MAVTVNDWCLDFACYPNARLNNVNVAALLQGYAAVRAFEPNELAAWPQMLRARRRFALGWGGWGITTFRAVPN